MRLPPRQVARGPLAGVPFLLKDVSLYSDGMPTTWGSRYLAKSRPRTDSTMVRQWRDVGLIILGKTNAPEFATEFITEPAAYGKTINPWDAGVTVGGSSGGAAAAVASGMVPMPTQPTLAARSGFQRHVAAFTDSSRRLGSTRTALILPRSPTA